MEISSRSGRKELRRWFGAMPARLRAMPAFLATLAAPAYA